MIAAGYQGLLDIFSCWKASENVNKPPHVSGLAPCSWRGLKTGGGGGWGLKMWSYSFTALGVCFKILKWASITAQSCHLYVMLSAAKHLYNRSRDPSVAENRAFRVT